MEAQKTTFQQFLQDYIVWASIAEYLTGEQIGRIKLTGSKLFWGRISAPGVVRSVNLGTDYLLFEEWPVFFKELPSVEELIFSNTHPSWYRGWDPCIEFVPKTLRKLTLKYSPPFFFHCRDCSVCSLVYQVPLLEHLDVPLAWDSQYEWMELVPRSLTSLSISRWDGVFPLPPTLIRLDVFKIDQTKTHPIIFPPRLEDLRCEVDSLSQLVVSLPPLLKRLSVSIDEDSVTYKVFGLLPRSLTRFEMFRVHNTEDTHITAPDAYCAHDFSSVIPPALEYCNVPIPEYLWPLLPPTLTAYINLSLYDLTEANRTTVQLHVLPKGITSLQVGSYSSSRFLCDVPKVNPSRPGADSAPIVQLFPTFLTKLHAPTLQLTIDAVKSLPLSLTKLEVAYLDAQQCELLPRGLVTLSVASTVWSDNFCKFLPPSLQYLYLRHAGVEDMIIEPNTGLIHKFGSVSKRPADYHPILLDDLPLSLTNLVLRDFTVSEYSCQNRKLSNLASLSIEDSAELNDNLIPLLSRHLVELSLPEAAKVSGKCFPFLPTTLRFLNLDSSVNIQDSDIQHLPRNLKSAYFKAAIHLTPACVKFLPRYLQYLSVGAKEILPHIPSQHTRIWGSYSW